MTTLKGPDQARLLLAFFLIYFIWGSTYLAIRYAIETLPPFLMAGTRFLLAGTALYVFMRLRGTPAPAFRQWLQLAVVGTFLFLGGNGLVVWAEQYVNSGLAALLVSTLPLWLITLDWLWAGGPAPTLKALSGIALGIIGMVVLVDPARLVDSTVDVTGALVVILASFCWAIGSIYSKKFKHPASIFMSAACQMTGGGLSLLLVSLSLNESAGFSLSQVSLNSFAAFSYLVVFGSMIAISAYVWLLQNASATSVSTYAFVNPTVAILLGWLLADEQINAHILAGAVIILLGVILVIRSKR
ncbi:MAG: EamA family transporter [Pseudomonadales bacterium]|nr:EamA family transporter [Pseudomonadales bacterium]